MGCPLGIRKFVEIIQRGMARSNVLWISGCLSICIVGCLVSESGPPRSIESPAFSANRESANSNVSGECKIESDIQTLSGASRAKISETKDRLINLANASENCRQRIIGALMKSMDKPNLDFSTDNDAFLLWRNGGDVLGTLKAVKSVDLLISHIGLTNGFWSSTMSHQPVLDSLIGMGPIAVSRLSKALREEPDRKYHSPSTAS